MFDIASQIMNNSWRNSKQKFNKLYDNLDNIPNADFLCFISGIKEFENVSSGKDRPIRKARLYEIDFLNSCKYVNMCQ